MRTRLNSAVLVLAAMAPLFAGAIPPVSEEITGKNVRQAEAKAKSAQEHLRIAQYYENQTRLAQAKLAEAQDLVKYWANDASATRDNRVLSPYWSAKSRADALRLDLESASLHAGEQQRLAESAR